MKQFKLYIQEKLILNKTIKYYTCHPKDKFELGNIIKERLKKDKDADLNDIDVSQIKNMSHLFQWLDPHNIKIDEWDMSNCEYIQMMFSHCKNFNCDLSKWNVSKVIDMSSLFFGCNEFKGKGLEKWNVSENTDKSYMFDGCNSLKNIPSWYKK